MIGRRIDEWTSHEDSLLLNTTIDYIRNGRTQLQAFEDVGEQIERTPAAVGFRFNSTIRKEYRYEIRKAQKERIMSKYYGKRPINRLIPSEPNIEEKVLQLIGLCQAVLKENEGLRQKIKDYQHIEQIIQTHVLLEGDKTKER